MSVNTVSVPGVHFLHGTRNS